MASTVITIKGHLGGDFPAYGTVDKRDAFLRFARRFEALAAGTGVATTVEQRKDAAQATGTLTLASVLATHTCTINGVVFTAVAGAAGANQFSIDGATDADDATALAAAINASVTDLVAKHVTASAAGAVVTVTSRQFGHAGNAVTIAAGQATIVASAARLTGGTDTLTTYTL